MKHQKPWLNLLHNEQRLLDVLLTDQPIPAFAGDPGSLTGRLYRTVFVLRHLVHGELEEAADHLQAIQKNDSLWCHQLASLWLQAEREDAGRAYARLSDWIQASQQALADRNQADRAQDSQAVDRRLAFRWAPVLRLYLTTLLDSWSPQVQEDIRRDTVRAAQEGISDVILKRLETMLRLARARQQQSVPDVLAAATDWYDHCQANSEYGSGAEFILDAVFALEGNQQESEALVWLDRALHLMPGRYELLLTKARLLKDLGDNTKSLAVCTFLLEHFPEDDVAYCLRSTVLFLEDRLEEALADANMACRLGPANPNAFVARGFVHLQAGDYQQALVDFRQALDLDPQAYDALRGEGKVLTLLGHDLQALARLTRLRRLYPEDADLAYEVADILFSLSYLDDCELACKQSLKHDPEHANATVLLGLLALRRQEDDLAGGLLERAVRLEPDNPFALNEWAYSLHLNGQDDQALALVSQALRLSPDYADAWCNKGLILYFASAFEEAEAAFAEAIQLAPDHVTAWVGRGNTLAQQVQLDEALACYDQALLIDPDSADACHGKALLYRIMGLEDEVLIWQERALQLDPDLEGL